MERAHQIRSRHSAFSLLEMLAVMAVMLTLFMLVGINANAILRGGQLTQASQLLHDQITLARQLALSSNQPVEVRLYRYADTGFGEVTAGDGKFRAVQLFAVNRDGAKAIGKLERLPKPVIIDSSLTLSPLIALAQEPASLPSLLSGEDLAAPLPDVGLNYHAAVFRFQPDGSTNLPASGQWFLTIHELKDGDNRSEPPPNFATLQIDPVNGRARFFRP